MKAALSFAALGAALVLSTPAQAQTVPIDGPALGENRVTQADIVNGRFTPRQLRRRGMEIFSTPFNQLDGMGDGPFDPNEDPTSFGGRPTLQTGAGATAQAQGTFMRVNGLDSQTCLECHSILSNRRLPSTFAIGGVGGIAASAFPGPTEFDVDDSDGNGFAAFNGRIINPPFLFGSGGVELAAKEMTADLQELRAQAEANPGTVVSLDTKGVNFGTLVHDGNDFDMSNVEGIDETLVVRPFGRKGDNSTVRAFDTGALQFHHGMQPAEVFGDGVDADGDGVADEILAGELSAIHVFSVNLDRPRQVGGFFPGIQAGFQEFQSAGCADCHRPSLETKSRFLPLAFPEVATDPLSEDNPQDIYALVNLTGPARFRPNYHGGVSVQLFSDLKQHDLGPAMEESNGSPIAALFITPRLWGVADTAPYMHDGRALRLRDAIGMHSGEAQAANDAFAALSSDRQARLLLFLNSLRTPRRPSRDL